MNDTPRYATLQDYLRVARERRLIIIVLILVGAGGALLYSARQPLRYEAAARLIPQDISQDIALIGSGAAQNRSPTQLVATYASRVRSPEVAERAKRALRSPTPPGELASRVSARVEASTGFLAVAAASSTGEEAARLANAFATAAVEEIVDDTRSRFRLAGDELERELEGLSRAERGSITYGVLQQRLFQLQALARFSEPVAVGEQATTPPTPVSPRPVRNTVLGAVLGFIVGLLAAFLRDSLDVRLRRVDQLHDQLGLPVVGRVREEILGRSFTDAGSETDAGLYGPDWEPFSILRTNLEFLSEEGTPKVVMVTSALAGEGKSTVAMRLAAASAAAGRRTLLVECDLRRPVLAGRIGVHPLPGLTEYLSGRAQPQQIVRSVSLPGGSDGHAPLACILAGTPTLRVAELINTPRFETFLRQVRDVYDLIVVDTPPLLAVADPLEVVPHVDAVLLCVRLESTRRGEAIGGKQALARAPKRPVGVVATGVRAKGGDDYAAYGYAYYDPVATPA